ncbi:hypothetical protein [Streptomyces sp. NPDC002952]|uniref:hypothetical protein n=1 Tax=Streptomyces sp. NPDC002952 TaxID=3364673 RepID=UPI0036A54871
MYIPQCGTCAAAVTDDQGREHTVAGTLLPADLRQQLAADGWQIKEGDARRGASDPLLGDRLQCPACTAALAARQATAERRHAEALALPRVLTRDLSARLGPGWLLAQRADDVEAARWLVEHQGTVHGMVNRYRRRDGSLSSGWEAHLNAGTGWRRLDAASAAQHRPNSSFLWSGRDLAAWGIAHRPHHSAPRPPWATRTRQAVG